MARVMCVQWKLNCVLMENYYQYRNMHMKQIIRYSVIKVENKNIRLNG